MMKFLSMLLLLWLCFSCSSQPDSHNTNQPLDPPPKENIQAPVTDNSKRTFVVPFQSEKWHSLKYGSIPASEVLFNPDHINIKVRSSAAPLIYPMAHNPLSIKEVSIKGIVSSLLDISPAEKQGEKGFDDFNLRLGLVLLGKERLSWYQKAVAADWVKQMFALAPKDQGIDRIYFLNGVLSSNLINKKRTHPLSKYIEEHYVWLMNQKGSFDYTYIFDEPKKTGALWISADGDDTGSNFDLKIEGIELVE